MPGRRTSRPTTGASARPGQSKLPVGREHQPLQWLRLSVSQSLGPPAAAAGSCAGPVWLGAIRQPLTQVCTTAASALSVQSGHFPGFDTRRLAAVHKQCCLTLRSSRPTPAWHLARRPVWFIIRPAGQAPSRRGRLSSNVRPLGHSQLGAQAPLHESSFCQEIQPPPLCTLATPEFKLSARA
jgi:hypothetical protein